MAARGTQVATIGTPRLAHQPVSLRKQRDEVAREVERHCKRTLFGWSRPTWSRRHDRRRTPDGSRPQSVRLSRARSRLSRPRAGDPPFWLAHSCLIFFPDAATRYSREHCSSLPSPPHAAQSPGTITRVRSGRASATTTHLSRSPDNGATCCVPAPPINRNPP